MAMTPRQFLNTVTTLAIFTPFLLGAAHANDPREPTFKQVASNSDSKKQNSAESKQPKENPLPFTVDTMNA